MHSGFGVFTGFTGTSTANTIGGPPPVTTGTSTPPYHVFIEKDPSRAEYQTISTMLAYRGSSLEELRLQDYQQNRKTAPSSDQTSSRTFASFGSAVGTQWPASGLIFEASSGTRFLGGVSAFGEPPQPCESAFGGQKPVPGFGSLFGQPSKLDPSKLECIEELLRKFMLGEELVNIQFRLFSAKSSTSGQVMKPRVLCANSAFFAQSSKYFLDLMSADVSPSDASLVDLMGDDDIPSSAPIVDYGYESDSDLEDCDDSIRVANPGVLRDRSTAKDDDKLTDDASDSNTFLTSSEHPREDDLFIVSKDATRSTLSSETAIGEPVDDAGLGTQTLNRCLSSRNRHILVKDSAFKTWYTLMNYVHTGKFGFLPLSSTMVGKKHTSLVSSLDVPKCSAKSMYRLASKVGLDHLCDEAYSFIRRNLDEHNILQELSCSLVSKYPQLREMELDVLYSHIASPSVVANFAAFSQRIARWELAHGADIIVGIHKRLLMAHYPFALRPAVPTVPFTTFSGLPERAGDSIKASDVPEPDDKIEDRSGRSRLDPQSTRSGSFPAGAGASRSTLSVPPQESSSSVAFPTSIQE